MTITPTNVEVFFNPNVGRTLVSVSGSLNEAAINTLKTDYYDLAAIDERLRPIAQGEMELRLIRSQAVEIGSSYLPDVPNPGAVGQKSAMIYRGTFREEPTSLAGTSIADETCLQLAALTNTSIVIDDGAGNTGGVIASKGTYFPDSEDKEAVVEDMRDNSFDSGHSKVHKAVKGYNSAAGNVKYYQFVDVFEMYRAESIVVDGIPQKIMVPV
jgi:hypothetical protein